MLSRPPKWILRWGVTIVFAVLVLVFAGAWVIRYPDLIKASFRLTSANAPKKRALLQQEITDLQALADNLREQHQIQAQDIQLAQEDYEIQQRLYHEKVIARLDLKREESKNISRRLPYQQTASAIISNLTGQRAKQKEILELDKQVSEERDKFLQALNTLRSAADAWIMKYVLTAPVAGRVVFPITSQDNQSITTGQDLLYVAPPGSDYIGELRVPQQNAGKVQVGQAVIVKFAGFPCQEFGAVRGRITAIADVPLKDSVFVAKVTLPNGPKTTYGQSLTVKTGMAASADIITDDSRLVEKLFYQLRKVAGGR